MENYIKKLVIQLDDIKIIKEESNFLESYFLVVKKNDYKKTLNDLDAFNELITEIDKVYHFNKFSVHYDCEMEVILNRFISSICMIKDEETKKLVLPLIIYLDAENILSNFLIKKGFFDNLITYVTNTLSTFSFEINADSLPSNHWETESYLMYIEGIKDLKISDIYHFIEAYELGGRTFESSCVSLFTLVLCALDFEALCNILDEEKDTIVIIFLISNLSIPDKLLLSKQSDNLILKIEVLRQLLYCTHNNISCSILYENEHIIIEEVLLDIASEVGLWQQFLNYYMPYPSRSPLLFKSMGSALDKLDEQQLALFLKSINLNYDLKDDTSSALNICFYNIKNDAFQKKIFIKILEIWEMNLVSNQENIHNLKLSNAINICILTVQKFTKKEDVENKVNIALNNIFEINNFWFETEIAQNNFLYKQLTLLFLYGFGVNNFKLKKQKDSIRNILNSSRIFPMLKKEYSKDTKKTLDCFNEYILNN